MVREMLDEFSLSCISNAFIQTAFGPRKLHMSTLLCLVLIRKQFKCGIFFTRCCLTMVLVCSLPMVGLKFSVFLLGLFMSHGLLVHSWAWFAKVFFFPCLVKERTMYIFFFMIVLYLIKMPTNLLMFVMPIVNVGNLAQVQGTIDLSLALHNYICIFHCFSICFQFSYWF